MRKKKAKKKKGLGAKLKKVGAGLVSAAKKADAARAKFVEAHKKMQTGVAKWSEETGIGSQGAADLLWGTPRKKKKEE